MEMDLAGWLVTGFAILITGISEIRPRRCAGQAGGALHEHVDVAAGCGGGDAAILITMDMVGIRAWRARPTGRTCAR